MSSILTLENVSFAYHQDTPALRGVTFNIEEGEFIGIIGPNGGGKTTLLKLILGFLKPISGKILVLGKPPSQTKEQLSYVPQTLQFDRHFPISVLDLVLAGRLSHLPWYGQYSKEDLEVALESLEKVGLQNFRERAFGTLSSGQAQRALIARALASKPKLLLLDEPTASVDAHSEAEIQKILKSLSGSITIMMVTHNLKTIINHIQRVICVQGEASILKPEEVCEHFTLGVYHPTSTTLVNNLPQRSQRKNGEI